MAEPLVSIIIPSYNYGQYLPASIDSALAQTYRRTEIIVLDDGSSDGSLEVARSYEPAVRALGHPNIGVIGTCNRGVREAAGEYFTFLSADDTFEPTYVEAHLRALAATPEAVFAYSDMRLCGAESGFRRSRLFSPVTLLNIGNYINGSALTRRSDYLEVGGYSEDFQDLGYEDWEFWVRMIAHRKRGTYVPQALLNWRRHETGSRNPTTEDATGRAASDRAVAAIKQRHRAVYASVTGRRDPVPAFVTRLPGVARHAALCRRLEAVSWAYFTKRVGATLEAPMSRKT